MPSIGGRKKQMHGTTKQYGKKKDYEGGARQCEKTKKRGEPNKRIMLAIQNWMKGIRRETGGKKQHEKRATHQAMKQRKKIQRKGKKGKRLIRDS